MKPTQAQFAAYQQIFDYFNRTLFDNSLPDCMLSFSRRRSSSNTLFTSEQWREEAGSTRAEISLNMKQLCENEPIEEVVATLVREMVHLWQERCGKSSGKWYFNREWAEKMVYRCPGCGAKVWGKGGLEIVCGCGRVFMDKAGEVKPEVEERVLRILLEKYERKKKNRGKDGN